jgi:hypothetical protein
MVQPELERRRSPLVSIPTLSGGDFQGIGSFDPMMGWEAAQEARSVAADHRLDEPTRLSLGMVASLQNPPPFHLAKSL